MLITLCLFILLHNNSENPTDYIHSIELNHVYKLDGSHQLSQIILWNWDYSNVTKRFELNFIKWYILDDRYFEKLTYDEYLKKDKEHQKQWVEKYGPKIVAPSYNRKFIPNHNLPRYDYKRKLWVMIVNYKYHKYFRIIYANYYVETWTQFDPTIEIGLFSREEKPSLSRFFRLTKPANQVE